MFAWHLPHKLKSHHPHNLLSLSLSGSLNSRGSYFERNGGKSASSDQRGAAGSGGRALPTSRGQDAQADKEGGGGEDGGEGVAQNWNIFPGRASRWQEAALRWAEEEEDNGDGDQLLRLRYWRETCSVSGKLGSQPKKQEFCAGMYADNAELKDLVRSKFKEDSKKPMQEVYDAVIDSDVAVMVRLVIVFAALNMWRVRKIIDQGIGVSLKKLSGGENNEELAKKYIELLLLHVSLFLPYVLARSLHCVWFNTAGSWEMKKIT